MSYTELLSKSLCHETGFCGNWRCQISLVGERAERSKRFTPAIILDR